MKAFPCLMILRTLPSPGSYNQVDHRDFEIEEALSQSVRLGATYDYSFVQKYIEPFKNIAVLDSSDYYAAGKGF
jgi:hypothetical protein